ncbi:MAG: zinc ribbon domain-containing protein [Eubacteriales bacterium]|nr:zinc ribbon domain-containing protein [Eubacteriales bacterium]
MPLYEYECAHCGHRFEKMLGISQRENVVCEKCGGEVRRVYQGACAFGKKSAAKGGQGCSGGCGGNCAGCHGCGH